MNTYAWTLAQWRHLRERTVFFLLVTVSMVLFLSGGLRAQDDDLFEGNAPAASVPEVPLDAPAAPDAGNADEADSMPVGSEQASPASPGKEPSANHDNYLVWMIRSLGWFFSPVFLFLSMTAVALMVMNIIAIRKSSLVPEELIRQFNASLDQQKYQEAYQIAAADESVLGKVLAAGLSRAHLGLEKAGQTMQDVTQEETMKLEHQIGYLALIGNLAPMIGLFGTVTGMITAFQVIASSGSAPSPQKLAEGIATALFTTMVGLAIALPSLAVYDIFKNRLSRCILEVGIISDNLLDRMAGFGKKSS